MVGQSCERFLPCYGQCAGCPAIDQGRRIAAEEILGMAADGQSLPLLRSVALVHSDSSAIVVEAFVDLRERKKVEQELGRLSEFNQMLVESTGEGIFSVDRDLRCTFANRAAASMLDYTPEELLGKDIHALFHSLREDGTPLPREDLPVMKTITGNSSHKADEVFWSKTGHPVPIQYLCNPLYEDGGVAGAVVVYRNVAEARALARKMDYLAAHDPLTGLLNRRAFERRLGMAFTEARLQKDEHVLCYIDLDQFKIVNDTCGHAAGDELLRQLSDILHARIRKSDTFARLGGDEFGLLLERCSLAAGMKLIEELLALLGEYRFAWNGKSFSLGASIGVVQLNKETFAEGNALSAADAACYVAKEKGRNRIHVYQPNDQDMAQRQGEMEWVSRIKEALDKDLFELWAQPIVPVETPWMQNVHMEVLLRMQGNEGALVNPGAFIPAAERFGLMPELDRWVVRQTLACLDKYASRFTTLEFCCINLSGQSITDDKFLDFLLEQFAAYPSVVGRLCFEITETAAVANLSRASQFMRRLKTAGCRFALDDFGSGMSSFAYLKNLPVDFLKIDGNFVRDMVNDRVDYAMVEAIHRVGSVMGIQTVAEFVENEEILACLKEIGVDFAQGYGICKPGSLACLLSQEPGPEAVPTQRKLATTS
jgi:diguanylate cyclase (GGDEF)-like protein/PAS domain S-box-containing protein